MNTFIKTELAKISFSDSIRGSDVPKIIATLHNMINNKGYKDIVLDFSQVTEAFAQGMLPVAVDIARHAQFGVDFSLDLPKDKKLEKLFINTNWAHIMSQRNYAPSDIPSPTHLPASQFCTEDEHYNLVNHLMDRLLGSLPGITRENLYALEWALNEITDNVITHAESKIGGFVQCTAFEETGVVEYLVCDAGLGIPTTLKEGHPGITDESALELAVQEKITRNRETNMGNGLFGSFRVAQESGGVFEIRSNHARLAGEAGERLIIENCSIPYNGTSIVSRINFKNPDLLQKALRFNGRSKKLGGDYLESKYENIDNCIIKLAEEEGNFSVRNWGKSTRIKILNLIKMTKQNIIIDCANVSLITSSYADELFGKLFHELGPLEFMERIKIENASDIVSGLIDRAIRQRADS